MPGSILVTSHYETEKVVKRAITLGVKILPKLLTPNVKLKPKQLEEKPNSQKKPDLVILEDNLALSDVLKFLGKSKGKKTEVAKIQLPRY